MVAAASTPQEQVLPGTTPATPGTTSSAHPSATSLATPSANPFSSRLSNPSLAQHPSLAHNPSLAHLGTANPPAATPSLSHNPSLAHLPTAYQPPVATPIREFDHAEPSSESDHGGPSSSPYPGGRQSSLRQGSAYRQATGTPSMKTPRRYQSVDAEPPSTGPSRYSSQRPLRYRQYDAEDWDEEWQNVEPERGYDNNYADYFTGGRRYPPRSTQRPPRSYGSHGYASYSDETVAAAKPSMEERRSMMQARPRPPRGDEEAGYVTMPPQNRFSFTTGIQWSNLSAEERAEVLRLPWTQWMNSDFKNHFVATLGELIGTTMFLFFAFAGTEVANIGSNAPTSKDGGTTTGADTGFNVAVLLYISVIFGFSLMVNVWVFFRISGGLFNPAVTLGMFMVRAISAVRACCLFAAQIVGSLLASVIVRFLFPETFNVRTTLAKGGASVAQGVFIEAILTAELVFTIFMLAKEKHKATFIAPVGIGLALFIAELVGVQFTGGSLNPARSFGPCVVTATFDPEHWIYWIGPLVGSLIAVVFYKLIKTLEYEMANPGADGDSVNDPTQNLEKRAELKSAQRLSALPLRRPME